jgi:hypothetical protein
MINQEVLQHLLTLPGTVAELSFDIQVTVPGGIDDDVVNIVRDNCDALKFDKGNTGFE